MKKRLFSTVLALSLALALAVPAAAVSSPVSEEEAAQVLAALDIMKGNEDGDMMLGRTMTRAELVKLTMAASPYRDSVGDAASVSPYPDVPYTHWAAPAVQAAVSCGFVTGYLDGTFRPDNTITLSEAVILALRLLGYQSTDFTGAYPSGQMALYRTLGLDKGVTAASDRSPVSRRDAMYLFYNLLTAPTKSGQVYCTTLGYPLTAGGELDRVSILNSAMDGPVICQSGWESAIPFSLDHATVYRAGEQAALSDLQALDLIYYSKSMRTLWAYTEQVTGSIQSVQPSAAAPTSVTVAGRTLALETADAAWALSDLGPYDAGDVVTLLLGRSGGVAAVVDGGSSAASPALCGVVTATGTGQYPDGKGGTYTSKTVTMVTTSGATVTYPQGDSATLEPGDLAQAYIKNGAMAIRHLTSSSFTGAVRSDGTAVGKYTFAAGVEILDTYKAGALRIYPSRLAGVRLTEGAVRYFQTNSAGEITRLILNDVTGDLHQYGVVTQSAEYSGPGLTIQSFYAYDLGGIPGVYQSSTTIFNVGRGPFQLISDGASAEKLKALTEVKLTALGAGEALAGTQTYLLSDRVLYYELRGTDYYLTDKAHVEAGRYTLTGWYDKLPSEGGRIRVIVAR